MMERLAFERQLAELQASPPATPVCRIDFYDQIDPHLQYLGRLTADSARARWEIRLADRGRLRKLFEANRRSVKSAVSSDFAVNIPGRTLEDTLFPESTGLIFSEEPFDYVRIAAQVRVPTESLLVQITRHAEQQKQMQALLSDAVRTDREQGFYIVIEPKHKKGTAGLYFVRAQPVASQRDEFIFSLGTQTSGTKTITYVSPKDHRQVIGTLHTHYLKSTPAVDMTSTAQGFKRSSQSVERIRHEVSALDVQSAKAHEIVVYAIEAKELHKAMPGGKALNRLKYDFNVLVDALGSFAGKGSGGIS
jgi:hypothetical protein